MTDARRVRHLALAVPRREVVPRASALVEDALRTATVPLPRPGCLLLVRHLDLGVLDLGAPSQALARRITEALRHLGAEAEPWASPRAPAARAVWFPDAETARAALIAHLVRGAPPTAWYWRAAVPAWTPGAPLLAQLPALLAPPVPPRADEAPAVVGVARVLAEVAAAGALAPLLAALPAVAAWSAPFVASWGALGPAAVAVATPAAPISLPDTPLGRAASAAADTRGTADPVVRWLAVCAVLATRPELAHLPGLPARVALPVRPAPTPAPPPPPRAPAATAPGGVATPPAPLPPPPRDDAAAAGAPPDPPPPGAPPPPPGARRQVSPTADARPPLRWLDADDASPHQDRLRPPPPLDGPAATDLGGLLFLLHPLQRLGMGALVAAEPPLLDCALPWRVLDALADVFDASPDEPVRRAIAPRSPPVPLGEEPFLAPEAWWRTLPDPLHQHAAPGGLLLRAAEPDLWLARWRDALHPESGALLAGRQVQPGPPVDTTTFRHARRDAWASATLRWCREVLRVAAATVVRRPAVIAATPTHLDVVLPASAVDLALRRAALDVDPGWVPWLGRVVRFHYVEDDDFARTRATLPPPPERP